MTDYGYPLQMTETDIPGQMCEAAGVYYHEKPRVHKLSQPTIDDALHHM